MDVFTAIRERRSCRKFLPEAVSDADIEKILEAGNWAPSPANQQPWEFVVITGAGIKEKIFSDSESCKKKLFERSGWKWLEKFPIDFVKEAPVIIAVVGDPKKSGADMFLDESAGRGYLEGCSAAVQNMMLAAHALGLGSLWFTLFEAAPLRQALGLDPGKDPVALLCLGKPAAMGATKRKDFREKTAYRR
ncbi:MAG TPA: nitroreductase family protein [Syntrophales bacterium]|nr:nitroreductase family protein [Syntrophales bacterium]